MSVVVGVVGIFVINDWISSPQSPSPGPASSSCPRGVMTEVKLPSEGIDFAPFVGIGHAPMSAVLLLSCRLPVSHHRHALYEVLEASIVDICTVVQD